MTKEGREKEIDDLLSRGVGEYIDPGGAFRKKFTEEPEKIVIKFGVDPTRPDIHLGHAVVLRKLRKFQDFGAKVIFLVGDFTAQIGDPTGRSKVRPEIDQKAIEENMKTYLDQVGKILLTDPKVFSWIRNSDWFISMNDVEAVGDTVITIETNKGKVSLPQLPPNHFLVKAHAWQKSRMQKNQITNYSLSSILSILKRITHSRLIARDMFQERLKGGEELYMHEMMYPVLQGIDSSVLAQVYGSCDLEVGGTDQTFNMLMGRDVMKINGRPEQAVLSFEILPGLDGKDKMSKSLDNYISIVDDPRDMYGKVMSIPDRLIPTYFTLCTYTPTSDIESIERTLIEGKENPRDIKMRLAREIVEMYHGREQAAAAEESFVRTFQDGGMPESIPEVRLAGETKLVDVLVAQGVVSSKTEFRTLVDSGAIEHMDSKEKITTHDAAPEVGTYRVGKKRFLKILP